MDSLMFLAGFIGVHSIWSVSDDETLVPIFATNSANADRKLTRYASEMVEDGLANARVALEQNAERAAEGVLAYDGHITLPCGKTDAIFLEIRNYRK